MFLIHPCELFSRRRRAPRPVAPCTWNGTPIPLSVIKPGIATCEIAEEIASDVGPEATLDDLHTAALQLSVRPDTVRSRLRYLAAHPERLENLARQSYWHINGFAKVKFVEGHGFCLRLHIWPAGEDRQGDVDPHGHRWEFASWVAAGSGIAETYFDRTVAADPEGNAYLEFDYGRSSRAGFLRSRGPAWLSERSELIRSAGDVYGCPLGVLHTVSPVGIDLVATVVLQGSVVAESASVFTRSGGRPAHALERPITVDELRHLFGAVEAAIGARAPG